MLPTAGVYIKNEARWRCTTSLVLDEGGLPGVVGQVFQQLLLLAKDRHGAQHGGANTGGVIGFQEGQKVEADAIAQVDALLVGRIKAPVKVVPLQICQEGAFSFLKEWTDKRAALWRHAAKSLAAGTAQQAEKEFFT
jgi:hypothetical protein